MTEQEMKNLVDDFGASRERFCPHCGARVQKYGKTPGGVQRYRCLNEQCRRQFVPGAGHLVSPEIKAMVLRMIAADVHPKKIYSAINEAGEEKISLRWIYILRRKFINDRQ